MSATLEPTQAAAPVARIYGEPMIELPADLYIPPDALEIVLEALDRKSTRLNSSHIQKSRMPSSA